MGRRSSACGMLLLGRRWLPGNPAPEPVPWGLALCSRHPELWSPATSRSLACCSPALPSSQSSTRHLAHPGGLGEGPDTSANLGLGGAGSLLPQTLPQQPLHQPVLSFAQMWHPEIRLQIKVLQNPGTGSSSRSPWDQRAAESLTSCWAGVGRGVSHRGLPCRRETEPWCSPGECRQEAAAKSERLCPGEKSSGEVPGMGAVSRVALGERGESCGQSFTRGRAGGRRFQHRGHLQARRVVPAPRCPAGFAGTPGALPWWHYVRGRAGPGLPRSPRGSWGPFESQQLQKMELG